MSGPRRFLIEERFHISGRGTVVVIAETTELPVGRALRATTIRPDPSKLVTEAFKELILRREPRPEMSTATISSELQQSSERSGRRDAFPT